MPQITWKTEKRKLSELKNFEKNPRKITKAAMEKLKDRIQKRGFHDVLKVDTNNVILSGNMRHEALIQLGVKEVEVKVPSRVLTQDERSAIVLESNRTDGEWDMEMLPDFGSEVLIEVGFESVEVDGMLKKNEDEEDLFDIEEAVKSIKKPEAKKGDRYRLGEHVLMCGDSTSEEDLKKLMGGVKANMVFTDPPYNVDYAGTGENTSNGIMNDKMGEDAFVAFSTAFIARMKENCHAGAPFYICSGYSSYPTFLWALRENGFQFSTPIIWVKNQTSMGWGDYRHKHEMLIKTKPPERKGPKKAEPILYGWKKGKHYFPETRFEADVWEISRRASNSMSHPTQKPLALINRAIKNSSKRGDVILDLFGGSGSTLVAAHKTGRKAYLMELDPKYVDSIIKRFEALTGQRAIKL